MSFGLSGLAATQSLCPVQLKGIVNYLERFGSVFSINDATDLDLAGGDVLYVNLRVG